MPAHHGLIEHGTVVRLFDATARILSSNWSLVTFVVLTHMDDNWVAMDYLNDTSCLRQTRDEASMSLMKEKVIPVFTNISAC